MQSNHQVQNLEVTRKSEGQRVDNFLMRELKGVPRSRVYRIIRRGEVRINKKRCKPDTKLEIGDVVRIPPYAGASVKEPGHLSDSLRDYLLNQLLYEDDSLLVINKPSGLAVHGGSGIKLGLIEALRQIKPEWCELELAHRIDRDTSGCVVMAKSGAALRHLHAQFKAKTVAKTYQALVYGSWPDEVVEIDVPLKREQLASGERLVKVHKEGKESRTFIKVLEHFADATLIQASPETGRTHQIRVHCQSIGHPILGDDRYAHRSLTEGFIRLKSIKSLCLHAAELSLELPDTGKLITFTANPGLNLANALELIRK